MRKKTLKLHRVNLLFTQKQLEHLDEEARKRTLSRASLVRDLVQKFLMSVREEEQSA